MSAQTVLYVEDEENDVFFMQLAWTRGGLVASLQIVRNGEQAVDYLAGNGVFGDRQQYPLPSLVILDLNLPIITGLEVLEWIRQHPRFEQLPVVILTSSDQPHDIERARSLRVDEFITKPSAPSDLIQIVQRLSATWLGATQPSEFAPLRQNRDDDMA